ncbi:hypothetical protein SETIT_4G014700v2 [Setaria italica]|uniref:Late embryogenesis abundant protein LEA-2 subgroup domain-containing protein n=1 Tax=Setaria italica TaxID=4555 RepID=K3Y0Y8_SETIT|nr:hypothetical protein SETIT_4G014700v2 [Setaria italica]
MAAAVDGGGDGENPAAFRCIDAVRYTVALVVTVLIVSVIVNAIKFVLRSDPLHISVVGGLVSTVKLSPPPPPSLTLEFNLRAQNPSGRARMYYVNITAYFFDSNTSASTTDPVYDSMVYLKPKKIPDIVVSEQLAVDSFVSVKVTNGSMPVYFDPLYGGEHMRDVTLRLDGNLTTEVLYGTTNTRPTTYYCEKLLLGGSKDDEAFRGTQDVGCRHEHPS